MRSGGGLPLALVHGTYSVDIHDGSASDQFSKRFGRLLRSIEITDRRKVLHSSRHTVKDQLRAARVPVAIQNAILGHADGSVGESYGLGYPVSVLLEAVSKINYYDRIGRRRSCRKIFSTARNASHRTPPEQEACGHR
jgi:hypothetical protein